MRKTFRRTLACLLAVLLVAFSMPFSALAATDEYSRKWWTADNLEATEHQGSLCENNFPYYTVSLDSEPEYIGANSEDWDMGWEFGYNEWTSPDDYDARDTYKPMLSIIVSNQGTATDGTFENSKGVKKANYDNALYNKYYGASTSLDYQTVKDAGNILNPAQLKKGQRIAVTFEWGGFDLYFDGQIQAVYDTEYLASAKYASTPNATNGDTWKTYDTATGGSLKTASDYYGSTVANGSININTTSGHLYIATVSSTCVAGAQSPVFTGTGLNDEYGSRGFGDFGCTWSTMSFEVLQDCDLSDVLQIDTDSTQSFCDYWYEDLGEPFRTALSDQTSYLYYQGISAYTALNWVGYEAADVETHTHTYGDVAYTLSDDGSTMTATATCTGCEDGTDGHTITETVAATKTADTATCGAAGTATYEATFVTEGLAGTGTVEVASAATGNHASWTKSDELSVAATCTTAGKTVYVCDACGEELTAYEETVEATGHTPDYANATYAWNADHTEYTATVPCAAGDEAAVETVKATVTTETTAAQNCQTKATTVYTATFTNEALKGATYTEEGAAGDHDYSVASDSLATAATCQAAATYYAKCSVCGEVSDSVTISVGDPVSHSYTKLVSEQVDATVDAAGKTAVYECEYGCGSTTGGEEIAQLEHYVITATAENGTAAVNGKDTANVAPNGNVTLTAAAAEEGYEFVAWTLNGKTVGTSETLTTKAIADADYVAVYAKAVTGFTVVFTDKYGNVYSTQTVTDGASLVLPDDPALAGFTFTGWTIDGETVDADSVKTLTASATVMATFEQAAADKYTVTVENGTIEYTDGATTAQFDYNTLVTVNAPEGSVNGTWTVNGAAVGYGTSYSFRVGSDITLTYTEDESVAAKPVVAKVSVDRDGTSANLAFLATRTTPDGYSYVNAGFVYGKNLTDADLDLNNVGKTGSNDNSGKVKVIYCSTTAEQFRLTYSISAMDTVATAKAFLAYTDADGETYVIYADMQAFDYTTNAEV